MPETTWKLWTRFGKEFGLRLCTPAKHPTLVFYFFVVVILVGGLGAWIPAVRIILSQAEPDWGLVYSSVATSAMALLASTVAEVVLARHREEREGGREARTPQEFVAFAFCLFVVGVLISTIVVALSTRQENSLVTAVLAFVSFGLALFLWWMGSYDNDTLAAKQPISAPTGGDDLNRISGKASGVMIDD